MVECKMLHLYHTGSILIKSLADLHKVTPFLTLLYTHMEIHTSWQYDPVTNVTVTDKVVS